MPLSSASRVGSSRRGPAVGRAPEQREGHPEGHGADQEEGPAPPQPEARQVGDAAHRRIREGVDAAPDELDGTRFSSSCDLPARDFGTLYSVLGHMHEFGAEYRMTLNPDTPDDVTEKLRGAMERAMARPEVIEAVTAFGATPMQKLFAGDENPF